jgi:hypothetical protein
MYHQERWGSMHVVGTYSVRVIRKLLRAIRYIYMRMGISVNFREVRATYVHHIN